MSNQSIPPTPKSVQTTNVEGLDGATCSACGCDPYVIEAAKAALNTIVRDKKRREQLAGDQKPYAASTCSLTLLDGSTCHLRVWICDSKQTVQDLVKRWHGFLPSDLQDAASVENEGVLTMCIWVRHDSTPARIAHEAYHAVTLLVDAMGINPNDYTTVRPNPDDPDFGYEPAELAAYLIETIVDDVMLQQGKFNLPNV
jgi:hypothetical protein